MLVVGTTVHMPVVRMPGEIKPQEGQIQNWLGFHKQTWVVGELIWADLKTVSICFYLGTPNTALKRHFEAY